MREDELKNTLKILCKNIYKDGVLPISDFKNGYLYGKKGRAIIFSDYGIECTEEAAKLVKSYFKINKEYLDIKIKHDIWEHIFEYLLKKSEHDPLLNKSIDNFLNNAKKYITNEITIVISLSGMTLSKSLACGKYKLYPWTQFKRKINLPKKMHKNIQPHISNVGQVVAVIKDCGEPNSLISKHHEILNANLNALRLYIPFYWHKNYDVTINLANNKVINKCTTLIIKNKKLVFSNHVSIGTPYTFDIDKKRTPQNKYTVRNGIIQMGYNRINKVLNNQNELANVFRNTLHWMGLFSREQDLNNKFLYLIFALENLFTNEGNNYSSITAAVSEKVAFILSRKLKQRLEIFNNVKKYYSYRSKIVHGSGAKIDYDNVFECYYLTLNAIIKAAKIIETKKINTRKSFDEHLFNCKFS